MSNENEQQLNTEDTEALSTNDESNLLVDQQQEEIQQEQHVQTPEELEKAKKYGYIDNKEDWIKAGKDPEKFKDPKQFNEFGENYGKSLKNELNELRKELHAERIRNTEESIRVAKAELERQLSYAKQNNDINAVENLARQQMELQNKQYQTNQEKVMQEQARANMDFVERNGHWFNDANPDLRIEATKIADEVFLRYQNNISYSDAAILVEGEMKRRHPEIVRNTNIPNPVISSNRSNINKSSIGSNTSDDARGYKSLSAKQQQEYKIMKETFEKLYPEDKYTVNDYLDADSKSQSRGLRYE